MTSFTIQFDGGWLTLAVYGYENTAATTMSDANWLVCRIDYELEGLTGGCGISISTTDTISFRDEVQMPLNNLSGAAEFFNEEEDVRIEMKFVSRGTVEVTGRIVKNGIMRYQIDFNSTSDQTRIGQCYKELIQVADKFPQISFCGS